MNIHIGVINSSQNLKKNPNGLQMKDEQIWYIQLKINGKMNKCAYIHPRYCTPNSKWETILKNKMQ